MRKPATLNAALRRRLFGRAARALVEPVDWEAINAAERQGSTIPSEGGAE